MPFISGQKIRRNLAVVTTATKGNIKIPKRPTFERPVLLSSPPKVGRGGAEFGTAGRGGAIGTVKGGRRPIISIPISPDDKNQFDGAISPASDILNSKSNIEKRQQNSGRAMSDGLKTLLLAGAIFALIKGLG